MVCVHVCACVRVRVCVRVCVCLTHVYITSTYFIGCSNDVYTSDHSPLFSVFSIEKVGQYTANGE